MDATLGEVVGLTVTKLDHLAVITYSTLAPLPLHGDAGGIADFDPDAARAGSIRAIDPLRNDTLGTESASMGEHGRAIIGAAKHGLSSDLVDLVDEIPALRGRGI
jgi:hypothetical protein